jgi:hypothetical protein
MTIGDVGKVETMGEADTVFRNPKSFQLVASAWAGPIEHL